MNLSKEQAYSLSDLDRMRRAVVRMEGFESIEFMNAGHVEDRVRTAIVAGISVADMEAAAGTEPSTQQPYQEVPASEINNRKETRFT